jgi:hypothetical protein
MKLTEKDIKFAADEIDRLVCAPIGYKFLGKTDYPLIHLLYEAARKKSNSEDPLTYQAAKGLVDRVKPGDNVIFITGWYLPAYMYTENDGPPGCAGLGRAINYGLEATPIAFSESGHLDTIKASFRAAGFHIADDVNSARKILRRMHVAAPPSPNMDEEQSLKIVNQLLDELNPSAVIAVEKSSPNMAGINHSIQGRDLTPINGKYHLFFDEARRRGIFTIGIGDAGNEIGMGIVEEEVRKYLPAGDKCYCPCGKGCAAVTKTDAPVVAFISNWGAYGTEAVLSLLLDHYDIMHDGRLEKRVLQMAAYSGACSPPNGFAQMGVDGLDERFNVSIVDQLKYTVNDYLNMLEFRHRYYESFKTSEMKLDTWIKTEYAQSHIK